MMYTEALQTVVLVVGAFILFFIGMSEVGGFTGLRQRY